MAGRFSVEAVFKAVDRVTAPISRMQNRVGKFTRSMSRGLHSVDKALGKTIRSFGRGAVAAAKFSAAGLAVVTGAATLLLHEFSKIEDAEAAFTPLLGGAKRAKMMVEALNNTAASTPFQFENLASSTSQLLPVMNGDIQQTIKTLRMLGDTAGGNAQKLDSITRGFTKAMLKGKVDMESLNMIAEAGVPIFQDLADVVGVEMGESFFKMISAGEVTTQHLTRAFQKLTGEGGKFFKGMEVSSKTLSGRWSTLKDNISLTAATIGGILAPTIKDLIQRSTEIAQKVRAWVESNKELINTKFLEFVELTKKFLQDLIVVFQFLRKHSTTIGVIIGSVVVLAGVLKTLIGVMTLVNLVMAANPIGLIVVGVAALIAGFTALVTWIDEIKAGFDKLPIVVQALLLPFGLLIDAIKFLKDNWSSVTAAISKLGAFFGLGSDEAEERAKAANSPQVVSPQDRTARSIEEQRTTSTAEVTIRPAEGTEAERTAGTFGPGVQLQRTGAF